MWDRGHDLRMNYIIKRMGECEEMLRKWFQEQIEIQNKNKTEKLKNIPLEVPSEVEIPSEVEVPSEVESNIREVIKDYEKVKKKEEEFDRILDQAVKEESLKRMGVYQKVNEYDKKLQKNLGLEYIKDFYIFTFFVDFLSLMIIHDIEKIDDLCSRRYKIVNGHLGFYLSPSYEVDWDKEKWYLLELVGKFLGRSRQDKSFRILHHLFTNIKNKKRLNCKFFKDNLINMSNNKKGLRILFLDSDNIYQIMSLGTTYDLLLSSYINRKSGSILKNRKKILQLTKSPNYICNPVSWEYDYPYESNYITQIVECVEKYYKKESRIFTVHYLVKNEKVFFLNMIDNIKPTFVKLIQETTDLDSNLKAILEVIVSDNKIDK